jgi:hypothetical protein
MTLRGVEQYAVSSSLRSLSCAFTNEDDVLRFHELSLCGLQKLIVALHCVPKTFVLPAAVKHLHLHIEFWHISGPIFATALKNDPRDSFYSMVAQLLPTCADLRRAIVADVSGTATSATSALSWRQSALACLERHELDFLLLTCDKDDEALPRMQARNLCVALLDDDCRKDLLKNVRCLNLQVESDFCLVAAPEGVETMTVRTRTRGKSLSLRGMLCSTLRGLDVSRAPVDPHSIFEATSSCTRLETVRFCPQESEMFDGDALYRECVEADKLWRAWLKLGLKTLEIRSARLELLLDHKNDAGNPFFSAVYFATSPVEHLSLVTTQKQSNIEDWRTRGRVWLGDKVNKKVKTEKVKTVQVKDCYGKNLTIWPQ